MYVGMNRPGTKPNAAMSCVPHVRGDEPFQVYEHLTGVERSPCTWG